ncbi:MAG: metalloregulator ArsR/SmtB family transcription factor [Firmicutes bacterium]|nr:metalloregulator ArsR/SmtB family transcription factor [Bacillota bacterium]
MSFDYSNMDFVRGGITEVEMARTHLGKHKDERNLIEQGLNVDKKTQELIREYIPARATLRSLANFFDILGDSTRIKILSALSISPLCVGDIAATLELNQTTVSHQLKNMRDLNIVDFNRQGKVLVYFIKENKVLDILLKAVDVI